MKKGLIIIYTGDGKGKTTAALGQAFRAIGHGMKICIIQFVKEKRQTGEMITAGKFKKLLEVHIKGRGFIYDTKNMEQHLKAGKEAWEFAKKKISSNKYDIIILDELTYLIKYDIVKESEILSAIKDKPEKLHIIITGRDASKDLIKSADLVSEIKNVKHPFQKGVKAQKGIEF